MKKTRAKPVRRPGISRIDQPSTRTHGWFVRVNYHGRRDGSYGPRHQKFFGDATYGGKRRALRAAQAYLAAVAGGRGGERTPGLGGAPRQRAAARGPWGSRVPAGSALPHWCEGPA